MSLLYDQQIEALMRHRITPWTGHQVGLGVLSYGLSSAGYDMRLGQGFASPRKGIVIDPKAADPESQWERWELAPGQSYDIHPGEHVLGHTVEVIDMPDKLMGIAIGKSTYARCGLIVNVTPIEPGWSGQITIEMHNCADNPIRIYTDEGIFQLLFYRLEREPRVTYRDRSGKYMGQRGVVLPKVRRE